MTSSGGFKGVTYFSIAGFIIVANCMLLGVGLCSGIMRRCIFMVKNSGQAAGI